jgi:YHS domain-containing protein
MEMTPAKGVTVMTKETCPVCEMKIDREDAESESIHGGKTYYFAGSLPRPWDANPEEYVEADQTARSRR